MDSFKRKESVGRPVLERFTRMKAILQAVRARMDDELQPLGITTSQLRMLWTVADNPGISGAEMARLCSVTPQSGQATMAMMEAQGWVRRKPREANHRVLLAELTGEGRRLLLKARTIAAVLDSSLWEGFDAEELAAVDAVLKAVVEKLER